MRVELIRNAFTLRHPWTIRFDGHAIPTRTLGYRTEWAWPSGEVLRMDMQGQIVIFRGADEVATVSGRTADGRIETVRIIPDGSPVANYGFDVTPARLVTGLITERGIIAPSREALAEAFAGSGTVVSDPRTA